MLQLRKRKQIELESIDGLQKREEKRREEEPGATPKWGSRQQQQQQQLLAAATMVMGVGRQSLGEQHNKIVPGALE